jgi:hypothetical protein
MNVMGACSLRKACVVQFHHTPERMKPDRLVKNVSRVHSSCRHLAQVHGSLLSKKRRDVSRIWFGPANGHNCKKTKKCIYRECKLPLWISGIRT